MFKTQIWFKISFIQGKPWQYSKNNNIFLLLYMKQPNPQKDMILSVSGEIHQSSVGTYYPTTKVSGIEET